MSVMRLVVVIVADSRTIFTGWGTDYLLLDSKGPLSVRVTSYFLSQDFSPSYDRHRKS